MVKVSRKSWYYRYHKWIEELIWNDNYEEEKHYKVSSYFYDVLFEIIFLPFILLLVLVLKIIESLHTEKEIEFID